MDSCLLNEATRISLLRFISQPSHAVIVIGPAGSGKTHLAKELAAQLLDVEPEKLADKASFRLLLPNQGTIGIEEVRELQNFLKLRTTGSQAIRRVCLIADAQTMSEEAQNAVLKTLEEPPEDTVLILTATSSGKLAPTIFSRAQRLLVRPVAESESLSYFTEQGYDPELVLKSYRISGGLVGLMSALLASDQEHPLVQKIEEAKQLLLESKFERLTKLDPYLKDRQALAGLIFALKRICQSLLDQAIINESPTATKLTERLAAINRTENQLRYLPNSKLLLTNLFLSL